jgi:hypothetical protein
MDPCHFLWGQATPKAQVRKSHQILSARHATILAITAKAEFLGEILLYDFHVVHAEQLDFKKKRLALFLALRVAVF